MSVSNQMAAYVPFILATLLVGGVLMGSRLPEAQRKVVGWGAVAVLIVVTMALLIWLALRSHNHRFMPSLFFPLAILLPNLVRDFVRTPRARRIFLAICGVLMLVFSFTFPYVLPAPSPVAALQIFRWAMIFCGAIMVIAAWGNWLSPNLTEEDEGPLRPALGGTPRHFGETS